MKIKTVPKLRSRARPMFSPGVKKNTPIYDLILHRRKAEMPLPLKLTTGRIVLVIYMCFVYSTDNMKT